MAEETAEQIKHLETRVSELEAEVKELGTQLAARTDEVKTLQVARYGWNRRKARRLARQMTAS